MKAKQIKFPSDLFPMEDDGEKKYTAKIEAPIYEPSPIRPNILELCDGTRARRLIAEIDESNLPESEKAFLRSAAARHTVFHYERIADYYSHASPEMQSLMEKSALVIIDFDSAIEQGYVRLCDSIKTQFMEEYPQ